MTWTFSASGSKENCVAQLEASSLPREESDAHQFGLMRAIVKDELSHYGDGSSDLSISATGHAPGGGGDRMFSLWISGKATPVAEPPAAEPPTQPTERSHRRK